MVRILHSNLLREAFSPCPILTGTSTCPCVLAYNERMKALDAKFGSHGLKTVFIFSNGKTDTPDKVAQFAKAQNYPWPCALDLDQKLLRLFDASCSTR